MTQDLNARRREAELTVYANLAANYQKFVAAQASVNRNQDVKELAAATAAVGLATAKADPAKTAVASQEAGRAVLEKAYGRNAQDVATVLAGRVGQIDLPKGLGRTDDMQKIVSQNRDLAEQMTMEKFLNRGRVHSVGSQGNYLERKEGREGEIKEKMVQQMLYVKSAIDAQVGRNQIDKQQGEFLYQRVQNESFQTQSKGASKEFTDFEKTTINRLKSEVAAEVDARYKNLDKTVSRVSDKEAETGKNQERANDFRTLKPEEAVKKHPDLVHAYAAVHVAGLSAGNDEKLASQMRQMVTERIAQKIEAGEKLQPIKMAERTQETARDTGMER